MSSRISDGSRAYGGIGAEEPRGLGVVEWSSMGGQGQSMGSRPAAAARVSAAAVIIDALRLAVFGVSGIDWVVVVEEEEVLAVAVVVVVVGGRVVDSASTFGARWRRNPSQSFQARSEARLDFDIVDNHPTAFFAALETVDFFSGTC